MTDPPPDSAESIDATATSAHVEFPCGNCGADMTWDPEADALLCAYCEHRVEVPRGEGTILERPLAEAGAAARGLGVAVRVARCETCGARVTFGDSATAKTCVYCGSPNVLAQEANRNALRPESLVPLDVGRAVVEQGFRRWVKGLWFRPGAIKRLNRFEAVGVYVPFWTFDCAVHSAWSADAGHYYYVTETYTTTENGKRVTKTRQVRKVRWVPAWGQREDSYDDMLVQGTSGVSSGLVEKLGVFDTTRLVPYRPEYLAGWRAEEYSIDLEQGWKVGQGRVESSQLRRCAGDVPGDTHRNLRVRNTILDTRWKHILLPIWSLQYRFGSKTYTVLVHGQNGRIVGEAPLSWIKIVLFVLMILGGIAAVALTGLAIAAIVAS